MTRLALILVAGAAALTMKAREASLVRAWSAELDQASKTPVQRVVALLTKMKVELENEAAKDAELFAQMECWCKTNNADKTQAISEAEAKIVQLQAEIEERAAKTAQLTAEVKQHKKEVKEAQQALDEATQIREKARAEFTEEDRQMMQAVANLKNAITVLGKHHKGLLQLTPELQQAITSVLKDAADKHAFLQMQGKANSSIKKQLSAALLQVGTSAEAALLARGLRGGADSAPLNAKFAGRVLASLAQQPSELAGYNAQSGQIFGILNSMLDEFTTNMSDAQKEEMQAEEEFKQLKAAKEEQIAAGENAAASKTAQAAENAKALADAKADLEETRSTRSADVEYLANVKLTCQQTDKDYENRLKTRNDEISAVADALKMLTEDENREQLVKTSFVELKTSDTATRAKVIAILQKASTAIPDSMVTDDLMNDWNTRGTAPKQQLSALAVSAQLDSFASVKEAMDSMLEELESQQKDEVKHRDFCTEEFNTNDKETFDKKDTKGDLENKIEELKNTITGLSAEIADHQTEIAATQVSIKKAGEDREAENAQYQTEVADQRATQEILRKVVDRLNVFYKKSLIQQEPPVKFGEYKANQSSSGVLSLLDKIIEDSKTAEKEAIAGEKASQANYETLVKDSNAAIKSLQDAITQKSEDRKSVV